MARSPDFLRLLDKYHIPQDASLDYLIDAARMQLVFCPSNAEAILLAYGQIPDSYAKIASIVEELHKQQAKGLSLRDALAYVSRLE